MSEWESRFNTQHFSDELWLERYWQIGGAGGDDGGLADVLRLRLFGVPRNQDACGGFKADDGVGVGGAYRRLVVCGCAGEGDDSWLIKKRESQLNGLIHTLACAPNDFRLACAGHASEIKVGDSFNLMDSVEIQAALGFFDGYLAVGEGLQDITHVRNRDLENGGGSAEALGRLHGHGFVGNGVNGVIEQALERVALDGLLGDQVLGEAFKDGAILIDDALGLVIGAEDDDVDFLVDNIGDAFAVVALLGDFPPEEDHLFLLAQGEWAKFVAHAVGCDHSAGDASNLFNVVGCACGDVTKDNILRCAAAKRRFYGVSQLGTGAEHGFLFGEESGVAAHHAARYDGDFLDGIGVGNEVANNGVSGLMVGGYALFPLRDEAALTLRPGVDAVDGLGEFVVHDEFLVAAGGQNSSLIDEVGEIRAAESGGQLGDDLHIDVGIERLALRMNIEDGDASAHVRKVDGDATVKASGAQERGVKDIGAVCGSDDDDVCRAFKAVHFNEDLVRVCSRSS